MICPNCGKNNLETSLFCNFCGNKLPKKDLSAQQAQAIARETKRKYTIAIVAVAVVAVIAVIIAISAVSSSRKSDGYRENAQPESSYSQGASQSTHMTTPGVGGGWTMPAQQDTSQSTNMTTLGVGGGWTMPAQQETAPTEPMPHGDYYTSALTGSTFEIPELGYAQVLFDGVSSKVPAGLSSREATQYIPYDRYLFVNLDGAGYSSTKYIAFRKLSSTLWYSGAVNTLSDLKTAENSVYIQGLYSVYLQYLGKYVDGIDTTHCIDYFDDAQLNILSLDDSEFTFYFYVKSHDSDIWHEAEGVGYVELDGTVPTGIGSGGAVIDGSINIPSQGFGGTEKCMVCYGTGVCQLCDGTGQTRGWKKMQTCTSCHGSTRCAYCKDGYVSY